MSIWPDSWNSAPDLHKAFNRNAGSVETTAKHVPLRQSEPIEVDGVFLGAAVEHELGFCFIAVDVRVTGMDRSVWPTLEYARRTARQMFRSNRTVE